MTLAEEMTKKYYGDSESANYREAIEMIKKAMQQNEKYIRFDTQWNMPEDWVVKESTIEYLKNDGFYIRKLYDEDYGTSYAVIWDEEEIERDQKYGDNI